MSSVCSSVLQDWGDHYGMYVGTTLIDPHVAIQRITSRSWCCPIYKCWRWEFFPLRGVLTYWFVLGRSSSSSALSSVCRVGMSSDYACLFGGRCYRERFLTTCIILLNAVDTPYSSSLAFQQQHTSYWSTFWALEVTHLPELSPSSRLSGVVRSHWRPPATGVYHRIWRPTWLGMLPCNHCYRNLWVQFSCATRDPQIMGIVIPPSSCHQPIVDEIKWEGYPLAKLFELRFISHSSGRTHQYHWNDRSRWWVSC